MDVSKLNPMLPPDVELIRANIRRPDDGTLADLVRTSFGIYLTMFAGTVRIIDQRTAHHLAITLDCQPEQ